MVQEWLNSPTTNYGVLLNSDPTKRADRWRFFASMEDPDASRQPYLQVTYITNAPDRERGAVRQQHRHFLASGRGRLRPQFSASLLPGSWSPETTPPVVVGDQVTVTVGVAGGATFIG